MENVTAGYRAFNGHIFTPQEAEAYNRICSETQVLADKAPSPGSLAGLELEQARNRQHRLFCAIIGEG